MHKRPVCCVCVFLMLFLCILDLAGVSIVRGNPLPQKVRQWIKAHPSAVIAGKYSDVRTRSILFLSI